MFNHGYKKQAIADLNYANDEYVSVYKTAIENIEKLQNSRKKSINTLNCVENYINSLKNTPIEYNKTVGLINLRVSTFNTNLKKLELEAQKTEKVSGGLAGAGTLAGAGIAAFGPSTAMSIAMTFGTASTGTAISTLSGAAATNAALAWLGGGTLAVGGGGMAAGSAFLTLAGPVGWAIGGTALLGSGIFASHKNKQIAQKAEKSIVAIKKETTRIKGVRIKVDGWRRETENLNLKINSILYNLYNSEYSHITNYNEFNVNQKSIIKSLLNLSESLSNKIGEVIK